MTVALKDAATEAGVDEAGRGCYFGPVACAAVVLPADFEDPENLVRDSKKLTERRRRKAVEYIKEHAIAWAVVLVDSSLIDKLNIYKANAIGMEQAVASIVANGTDVRHVAVDGDRFPGAFPSPRGFIPFTCVVGGDNRQKNIAAASILAKTARDEYVCDLCDV